MVLNSYSINIIFNNYHQKFYQCNVIMNTTNWYIKFHYISHIINIVKQTKDGKPACKDIQKLGYHCEGIRRH